MENGTGQTYARIRPLESNAHTLVIRARRMQTGDSVSAILSGSEQKTINGQEYSIGPSLEVEPNIACDFNDVITRREQTRRPRK